MTNVNCLNCKNDIRVCVILEALYLKNCIRKYAITSYHPSVRNFIELSNELNTAENQVLNSIDNTTIYDILNN